jgi:anti-sigma B factor antagonist
MPLKLETRVCGDVCIIQCEGRIVLGKEATALESVFTSAARECSSAVLNLRDVDRIDSIGIGLLVRVMTGYRKRGGGLCLASAPSHVLTLLRNARLSEILPAYPSEEEAVSALAALPQQKPLL